MLIPEVLIPTLKYEHNPVFFIEDGVIFLRIFCTLNKKFKMADNENPGDLKKPSENEIADYYDDVKKLEMKGHENGIKKARTALFATAVLLLIGEIITANAIGAEFTPLLIGIIAIEVGVFVALALWTKTKPFTAIVVGLILFILYWVLGIALNGGEGIYKGALIKVIIIVLLASALKPARDWERLKKNG